MADKPKIPKLDMTRRGFLGVLGTGIAAALMGGVRTAPKVAAVVPEITAQGMPNWFPLLVNRIKTEGKQTRFAGSKKQPEDVYVIKDSNGNDLVLNENKINGNISVYGRGDESQQFDFEYIPATEYSRPDGKSFVEDSEFYAYEKYKTDGPDVEMEGYFDEMRGGYETLEQFATKGKKITDNKINKLVEDFNT